jgi:hypothetical protein
VSGLGREQRQTRNPPVIMVHHPGSWPSAALYPRATALEPANGQPVPSGPPVQRVGKSPVKSQAGGTSVRNLPGIRTTAAVSSSAPPGGGGGGQPQEVPAAGPTSRVPTSRASSRLLLIRSQDSPRLGRGRPFRSGRASSPGPRGGTTRTPDEGPRSPPPSSGIAADRRRPASPAIPRSPAPRSHPPAPRAEQQRVRALASSTLRSRRRSPATVLPRTLTDARLSTRT